MKRTLHAREVIPRWTDAPPPAGYPKRERGSVVETLLLGTDAAHARMLDRLQQWMSVAVGEAIRWIKDRLAVVMGDDPTGATKRQRLIAADLKLAGVDRGVLPRWVQELFPAAPGAVPVEKPPDAIRLAWGFVREQRVGGKLEKVWKCAHLHPKFQLQQLLLRVLPGEITDRVPKPLRPGLTQEIGQQLASHLMLADSGTVALAAFPTTEGRDPAWRRRMWEEALVRTCQRAEPLPYQKASDVNPKKYPPGTRRGDRDLNIDPDWIAVLRKPEARRSPLLFVTGGDVRLYRRVWERPGKRPGDPLRVSRATYAAIPVDQEFLDELPADLKAAADWWKRPAVVATLSPLLQRPVAESAESAGEGRQEEQGITEKRKKRALLKPTAPVLLIPLSYGRRRTERRVLPALARLPIQWARIVRRTYRRGGAYEKWFLQLTIGYAAPKPFPARVLGIHFGIDNIYYWALAEARGAGRAPSIVEEGTVQGNPILRHNLAEKADLEWDQEKERWVGGDVYAPALKGDAHLVVDGILGLARAKCADDLPAGIAVERIRYIPKGKGPTEENRRFSNWDYGQLRKLVAYKGPPAGVWITEVTLKKTDRQQPDAEQARRLAREGITRLHDRRRRAEESEREPDVGEGE